MPLGSIINMQAAPSFGAGLEFKNPKNPPLCWAAGLEATGSGFLATIDSVFLAATGALLISTCLGAGAGLEFKNPKNPSLFGAAAAHPRLRARRGHRKGRK